VVYGDSRSDVAVHQQVIDRIAALDPQLILHSGDVWDGYGAATFGDVLGRHANVERLLESARFVVSRGNHESLADYLAFTPSLSHRSRAERFSFALGNSFFVVAGTNPALAPDFIEAELRKPEAAAARWRFVQSHYPVYSSGTTHGASGIPAVEKICDQYHVAVYWSGHDHIYERSHQVFGGRVVDTGDHLAASHGTVYVVSGGGGAPLYGAGRIPTTHLAVSTHNFIDVVAEAHLLTVRAYRLDGSVLDTFTIVQ
jgi:hypothetical protein